MMRTLRSPVLGALGVLISGLVLGITAPAESAPYIAVAKYVKGPVQASAKDSAAMPLRPSDLLLSSTTVEAGQDGKAMLRLLPDNAYLDVRPGTVFTLRRTKSKDKRIRRIILERGEVVFGLRKKSEPVQCENIHTTATAGPAVPGPAHGEGKSSAGGKGGKARFSCRMDDKAAGILIVQDGEVTVYNRPKNITATARSGQKAISDLNGIRITDATDAELESVGFRQNTLEIDFLNPQTDAFTTLEAEYESTY